MAPSDAVEGRPNNKGEGCQADKAARVNIPITISPPLTSDKTSELATEKDNASFPFLRLPPELRNKIYRDAMVSASGPDTGCSPLRQPAITHVSRQLRAEALPIYYGERIITHKIFLDDSSDCVPSVQGMVDAFAGGPNSVPGPGTLQHISRLELDLDIQEPMATIRLILSNSLEPDASLLDDVGPNLGDLVRVGDPGLDWADATAVRAARNEAAAKFGQQLFDTLFGVPRSRKYDFLWSCLDTVSHMSALHALDILARACPRLTSSVFVCDLTLGKDTQNYDEDG